MTDETNILPTDTEDTEGHKKHFRSVEDAGEGDTVDTEGHVIRSGRIEPAAGEGEDTEGHRIKRG